MADETTQTPQEPEASADDKKAAREQANADKTEREFVYSRAELVNGASAFGTTPEGMAGALHLAGDIGDGLTRSQAEKAVTDFNEREV